VTELWSESKVQIHHFSILATTSLRDGRCWTVPTLIEGLLYVRDREGIAAYDLR
jgi:hypothetical protein